VGRAILGSAGRAIFGGPPIGRPADDTPANAVYRARMHFRGFRPDPLKVDWILAAVLVVVGELEVWLGSGSVTHHHWVAIGLVMAVLPALVAVRRLYPGLAGIGAAFVANVVALTWGPPSTASFGIAWMCCMYALAAWARRPLFVAGALVLAVPTYAAAAFGAGPSGELEFTTIALIVLLLVRRILGDRERRAQMAERERDLAAREAVVEERARIARELHDVIAHNVSMMVVQAGGERRLAQGSTRDVLETIEQIGRSALTEMRRLVGMLRTEGDEPLAPQPGLDDVPRLVTQVREAGLPVELEIEGERRELPVGIELSAYRIVQEALTNALKHAGNAQARVRISYGADSLELEIVDDGAGPAAEASGAGHGLVGMRERVALYGGRLDARRRESGGFAVRALLPIR
jgi:signal transduction histidine kinase